MMEKMEMLDEVRLGSLGKVGVVLLLVSNPGRS